MTVELNATSTRPGPRTHDLGAGGVVSVAVEADDVRIRGVDGTQARLIAPADGAAIEIEAGPGRFTVRNEASRGSFLGLRIGILGIGARRSGTVELEVPRDAQVEVSSATGDVSVHDVRGGTQVRTISGKVSLTDAAGRIGVDVASGDVTVAGVAPLSLEIRSVSGSVRARGPRFDRVAVETVSGDTVLEGTLSASAGHTVSTVSGAVQLATPGNVTLEVKTVSGSVDCRHPERRDGDGRGRPLVIGSGAARLAIRSMSGDVRIRAAAAATVAASDPAPSLAVLEALSRGEIDVAEAERRLAGARDG